MRITLIALLLFITTLCFSQTKVSGIVVDDNGDPVAFANVIFPNSTEGTITNDNGRFYLESDQNYNVIQVSFIGYQTRDIELLSTVNYDLRIVLSEGEQLDEVVVYVGKRSKKDNPAIDILRKIWAKKRINGLRKFKQYEYDKYEKVEFDLNTIDSALIKSRVFKGLEFVFADLDTSRITGKTYLPIFLNEVFSKVYGNNEIQKERVDVLGNKNSGFTNNQAITAFVQDLYSDYDVYANYLKFFDKSFTSPLSRTGIDVYNYILSDSAYIDNKWCYHIIYYPRRKNELTFKGDFWVNDTTYALKKINLEVTKSANINWVKEIYIEQDFEVVSDSVFLLKRDYMLSDFALNKKESSKGVYGKRTTVYDNYKFDQAKPEEFYRTASDPFDPQVFQRDSVFWSNNRLESLNKDESGIYALLDTLKTVPKFKTYYNLVSILSSGYVEIDKWNIDIGDIYSTFGYNDAEGIRLRGGARTYFGQNDPWRLEGYMAYGFMDKKVKHGFSAKFLLDKKSRLIISGGNRRDIEQLGLSLTATNDVLGRSVASSSVLTVGNNDRLTSINLSTLNLEAEPLKNFRMRFGGSFRTLRSALPQAFNLDYIDPESPTGISSEIKQFDLTTTLIYTPGKRTIGYGVERRNVNDEYATLLFNYTRGLEGFLESDFSYAKYQFSYTQPWQIGGFGRLLSTLEMGKTTEAVPLSLLNVIPGNQTLFTLYNTFPNLDFYEFVTDTYIALHLEQNFNGRLFSRIPIIRDWNLREIVGLRGAWGQLSDENIALNSPTNIPLAAPSDKIYWEYSFGISNIFKIFRVDFNFRGNYLESPDARPFSVTGTFGFNF
ncbi:MAG: carboxypeptidase-like regulatory domain-containing protein [Flavobacteriaceae bacterium]|nr:carboxypeptidase-like regulatory domain-containing protein [Muriicola sp.]NNL40771.1 carboxypeptidase-like regulatory domain-containing protein [Flavobacteriaceae bacterium]